jgi:phospholipid/cholesterol/gamma-HCH transport system substrate-binding protein
VDEIFRSFDAETRAAFQTWMQTQASAGEGRGADINAAFANLPEFVSATDALLAELNAQSDATSRMIRSTGDFFDAISERQGQLRTLITESNRLFETIAARDEAFADIWREFPRFERESMATLPRLTQFSERARPVVERLQPAAEEMGPAFAALERLSPEMRGFFTRLGPVISASERGVPALERTMKELPPLLEDFEPFLRNFNPMLAYLGMHRREVTSFVGNLVGTTLDRDVNLQRTNDPVHYLRAAQPLGPEALAFYPRPLGNSRASAYSLPEQFERVLSGLPVYDTRSCGNGGPLPPEASDPPELQPLIKQFAFRTEGRDVARPACVAQGPFPGFGTSFPQLEPEP